MDSYYYLGPSTDMANTASLPQSSRFTTSLCKEPTWRPEPLIVTSTTETYPAYRHPHSRVGGSRTPGPADGALHRTAELLAKLLSGSADGDVTALSEAVRAKLGITEPLAKPAMASPSPSLTSLANNLKGARVSRLLPKVTCPSPFHPCSGTVPIAELQDVPVTEAENRGLTALTPLAGKPPPPFGSDFRGWEEWQIIAQANIQVELPEFGPKNVPEQAEEFAEFLLLTAQFHVDVTTKCSLLKRSSIRTFLQKQVERIAKTCSSWAEGLQQLKKTFRVYETDLSVRTQIDSR